MGYWDYNETTGQPYYVEDTPDLSGGAQENDPNYLYLQGYGNAERRGEYENAGFGAGGTEPSPQPPMPQSIRYAFDLRDRVLAEDTGTDKNWPFTHWTPEQAQYLADIPAEWGDLGGAGEKKVLGTYSWDGKIAIDNATVDDPYMNGQAAVMGHELLHALYFNMLSPEQRQEYNDLYEQNWAAGNIPGKTKWGAVEMYPRRRDIFPENMLPYYDPPTTPVNQWPVPAWRKSDPTRGY